MHLGCTASKRQSWDLGFALSVPGGDTGTRSKCLRTDRQCLGVESGRHRTRALDPAGGGQDTQRSRLLPHNLSAVCSLLPAGTGNSVRNLSSELGMRFKGP